MIYIGRDISILIFVDIQIYRYIVIDLHINVCLSFNIYKYMLVLTLVETYIDLGIDIYSYESHL